MKMSKIMRGAILMKMHGKQFVVSARGSNVDEELMQEALKLYMDDVWVDEHIDPRCTNHEVFDVDSQCNSKDVKIVEVGWKREDDGSCDFTAGIAMFKCNKCGHKFDMEFQSVFTNWM